MPFSLARFARLRPFLYHMTAPGNIARISAGGQLDSASEIMRLAGDTTYLFQKRREHVELRIGGSAVLIRDQSPLYEGNISMNDGWTFADIIELLNTRVFFWPGDASGPHDYGWRHFDRYRREAPAIIRVDTAALFAQPGNPDPEFCRYNSGAPRCSGGSGSPRGASTFVDAAVAAFTAGQAVEVTFPRSVRLPIGSASQCSLDEWGRWRAL